MAEYPKSGLVTLRANLADYAVTKALKSGAVKSDLVNFDFCGPKVALQGFKRMDRDGPSGEALRQAGDPAARRRRGPLPAQSCAALHRARAPCAAGHRRPAHR